MRVEVLPPAKSGHGQVKLFHISPQEEAAWREDAYQKAIKRLGPAQISPAIQSAIQKDRAVNRF
jgi:hypothetical protein